MGEPVFVTGGLGCVGAWVCRVLLESGDQPVVFDLAADKHRLDAIMAASEVSSVRVIAGDLTDHLAVRAAVEASGAERIIHLAALQVPLVRANPPLGAAVNVVGTTNVFESARVLGLDRVVFASSVAIYGPPGDYDTEILPNEATPRPADLYGAFKVDNELSAKIYHQRDGVSSIGLRPHTVYGPGRDQGITSEPTQAILAATAGDPYEISYGGRAGFMYVEDVARTFVLASKVAFEGAESYGMRGVVASIGDFVRAISTVLGPDVEVTHGSALLPLAVGLDETELAALLGPVPNRSLEDGVRATAEHARLGPRP